MAGIQDKKGKGSASDYIQLWKGDAIREPRRPGGRHPIVHGRDGDRPSKEKGRAPTPNYRKGEPAGLTGPSVRVESKRPVADGLVGLSPRRRGHVLCSAVRTIGWQHQTVWPIEAPFAR